MALRNYSARQFVLFAVAGIGAFAIYQALRARRLRAQDDEMYEYNAGSDMIPSDYLRESVASEAAHARRRGAKMPIDVAAEVEDAMLM